MRRRSLRKGGWLRRKRGRRRSESWKEEWEEDWESRRGWRRRGSVEMNEQLIAN